MKDAQAKEREEVQARNNAAEFELPTLWKAVQNTLNKLSPLPELAGGVAIGLLYHKGLFPLIRGSIPPNPEQVTYPDPTWDKFSVNQYTQCYSYALNTVEKKNTFLESLPVIHSTTSPVKAWARDRASTV